MADAADTQARVRAHDGARSKWSEGGHYFAAGIVDGRYSSAHVTDPSTFDVTDAFEWFAQNGEPLVVRAPRGYSVSGTNIGSRVLMQTTVDDLRHGTGYFPTRRAASDDIGRLMTVDRAAFGEPDNATALEQWIAGHVRSDDIVTGAIELMGSPVATGYVVLAEGKAGRTAQIGGIAVVPMMKRRGLGAAITTWLADYAFEQGCDLVHLYTDSDDARRLYTRLGFTEVGAIDVWVSVTPTD